MKSLILMMSFFVSFGALAEIIDLAPKAPAKTDYFTVESDGHHYDPRCVGCESASVVKKAAKMQARKMAKVKCLALGAEVMEIKKVSLERENLDPDYILGIGAPRDYRGKVTARCLFK